ncbi:MotA/TolQ/ExbB proton channel family protein [Spirulina subsalsa FACHB-351]|uniref:MotA/TolQ/ExbB proton channel family protein n=1 Tax=Spirulina subsalsa FACHB-351 TaxID=234711 RepID=A0ABT3L3S3_9CYAN|nr:MotA/TolQ/ExbB proton channel family protein [Spirulina subsalsa]MCW6036161.1 MotA/TolQ/ExbB proton channel family protein [Spirulina subsalsa FACHB-351]
MVIFSVIPVIAGGWVTVPLLGCSVLALVLIGERVLFWTRVQRRQRGVIEAVLRLYPRECDRAYQLLQAHLTLPLPRIFWAALSLDHPTPEEFRLALESATQGELPILKRFNTVFETIITVAPLLGLLGTILGLMQAFSGLQIGDLNNSTPQGVTGGISEALVSTGMGLVVAIITLLFANSFRGLYLRQLALIQELGGQLELLYRHHYTL